jgi:hypothetical protein
MKYLLLVTLLFTVWTANATRSRMESLGQDPVRGSYYIEDNRNIFRNTADVNQYRNFLTFEIGRDRADGSGRTDAEGGYFSETDDFAWGVYLGRNQPGLSSIVTNLESVGLLASATADSVGALDGTVDLYFGGDAGVEWGLNIRFGMTDSTTQGTKTRNTTFALNAGIRSGDLGVYAGYGMDKYEVPEKLEGGLMTLGLTYALKDATLWFQYDGGSSKVEGSKISDVTGLEIGVGRIHEISPMARLNFDVQYEYRKWKNTDDLDDTVGAPGVSVTQQGLPLVIGAEVDATSWLVLRGSVTANLFGLGKTKVDGGDGTATMDSGDSEAIDFSTVNAGATLNFGKLKIDGNLGVSRNQGSDSENFSGLFDSTNMFANAAIVYWF